MHNRWLAPSLPCKVKKQINFNTFGHDLLIIPWGLHCCNERSDKQQLPMVCVPVYSLVVDIWIQVNTLDFFFLDGRWLKEKKITPRFVNCLTEMNANWFVSCHIFFIQDKQRVANAHTCLLEHTSDQHFNSQGCNLVVSFFVLFTLYANNSWRMLNILLK